MAIKPVSLTYGGDAATALKWVGFAKKKARMLADWCMSNGQPTGNNHIWPVPDVKIRVWYNNGMLKAHIESAAKTLGFAFKRHDTYSSAITPFWWDIARTRSSVVIDVGKGAPVARGASNVRYGSWPCQETANGSLITVAEYKLVRGRGDPVYSVPLRAYSGRRDGRMDVGYPLGDENTVFYKGAAYATMQPCFGAFKHLGVNYVIELTGGYTTGSVPQGRSVGSTAFSSTATYQLVRLSSGFSGASSAADRSVVATTSVAHYVTASEEVLSDIDQENGLVAVAPDGAAALAVFTSTPTPGKPIKYLRATTIGGVTTWAFSTVVVTEGNIVVDPVTRLNWERCYDFIYYQGSWVPATLATHILSFEDGGQLGYIITAIDLVVLADTGFNGNFTEIVRIDVTAPGLIAQDIRFGGAAIPVNMARGLIKVPTGLIKLDYDTGLHTVLTGIGPTVSFSRAVHTRKDYILVPQGEVLSPLYTDGALTGYTVTELADVQGMAAALGDGFPASDAVGHYGLLGTI